MKLIHIILLVLLFIVIIILNSIHKKKYINYKIKYSPIEGKGVFSNKKFNKNQIINNGINYYLFIPYITKFGRYINHSWNPNTKLENNKIIAIKDIDENEEFTLNYQNTPWYIAKPDPNWK